MKDECLICGAPLVYLQKEEERQCALCGRMLPTKTVCAQGHFVCDACHTRGVEDIAAVCLAQDSKDPVQILRRLMALPFCHMHGPEHHILVGSALLTAYRNAGGDIDLVQALDKMQERGSQVPGGACGFWGACGAGISAGIFVSIVTGSTPLKNREWGLSNAMTARALSAIAAIGGPRCCKRNGYTAITAAVEFCRENLGVDMELSPITCIHSFQNNQCIADRCPYHRH